MKIFRPFIIIGVLILGMIINLQAQVTELPNGNVGIGITLPNASLHVNANEIAGVPVAIFNNTWANYSREVEMNHPFVIRRGNRNAEALFTFIQDGEIIHEYRNDETSNRMVYRMVNTDTEAGGGVNANRNEVFVIHGNGFGGGVSVGTTMLPFGYRMAVDGKLIAEEVQIKLSGDWSDFVFNDDYKLKDLEEVESFIEENNHLPDIPSEKEVKDKGINLGDMDAKLLQKIEELTLYVIDINKRVKSLEKENKVLKDENKTLKTL